MTIKDALLYVSPVPGGEMTAGFAAGLAQHFGTEVTGLTFAFDVAYPAGLYARVPEELFQKLREKDREDAMVAMTHAKGVFDQGTSKFVGVMETCLPDEAIEFVRRVRATSGYRNSSKPPREAADRAAAHRGGVVRLWSAGNAYPGGRENDLCNRADFDRLGLQPGGGACCR